MKLARLNGRQTPSQTLNHLVAPDEDHIQIEVTRYAAPIETVRDDILIMVQDTDKPGWDAELAPRLHKALNGQPRRILTDMGFWHWMNLYPFRNFVVNRWFQDADFASRETLTRGEMGRFYGSASLNGYARNATSRLYWVAETLWHEDREYSLAQAVLKNQDFIQVIFDRKFGLHPEAATAFALEYVEGSLVDSNEKELRDCGKRLNFFFSTIAPEQLSVSDIRSLIKK